MVGSSLDDLIHYLVEEIAFSGEQGASVRSSVRSINFLDFPTMGLKNLFHLKNLIILSKFSQERSHLTFSLTSMISTIRLHPIRTMSSKKIPTSIALLRNRSGNGWPGIPTFELGKTAKVVI